MSQHSKSHLLPDWAISIALTLLACGLFYWLWQDVQPLSSRLFSGDQWALLRDLQLVLNVAVAFVFVTLAGLVFDRSGAASIKIRLIAFALLMLMVFLLVRYGTFFSKEIWPVLRQIGFWL